MYLQLNFSPSRIAIVLLVPVIALVICSFILGYIVIENNIDSGPVRGVFDYVYVDREINIPTWFSSILLALAGFLLMLIALNIRQLKQKYSLYWGLLGFIFWGLSLDENISLHEQSIETLRELFDASGVFYFTWIIPAVILVSVIGLFFLRFFLHLPARIKKLFFLAGALYIGGAVGMEALGGLYFEQSDLLWTGTTLASKVDIPYMIAVHIEELLEMSGIVIFIYALLHFIQSIAQKPKTDAQYKHQQRPLPV